MTKWTRFFNQLQKKKSRQAFDDKTEQEGIFVKRIFSGGDRSFAYTSSDNTNRYDCRIFEYVLCNCFCLKQQTGFVWFNAFLCSGQIRKLKVYRLIWQSIAPVLEKMKRLIFSWCHRLKHYSKVWPALTVHSYNQTTLTCVAHRKIMGLALPMQKLPLVTFEKWKI